jgi:hypothetical protein
MVPGTIFAKMVAYEVAYESLFGKEVPGISFPKTLMLFACFRPISGMKNISSQLQADSAAGSTALRNPWHSAFVEALQMELRNYRDVLEFLVEFQLTDEPLRIDCLVVRKAKDVEIKKNIGTIFKTWNLFEYKSPGDYVSVDDFYKVYGYACLYTSLKKVPITSLTVSFVESRHPRKLLRHLQNVRGYTVAETTEGIYSIQGDVIPMQIIDSRKLSADENLWLKSLSNKLNSGEITRISEEITRQKKEERIAAYLYAITQANTESIQEAMEMRNALTLEQVIENTGLGAKWEARGRTEGLAEKALEIARKMKAIGRPLSEITEITGLSTETVQGKK